MIKIILGGLTRKSAAESLLFKKVVTLFLEGDDFPITVTITSAIATDNEHNQFELSGTCEEGNSFTANYNFETSCGDFQDDT